MTPRAARQPVAESKGHQLGMTQSIAANVQRLTRLEGKVVRIKREKGFGFLSTGTQDYFFHLSDFAGPFQELEEGQAVSFCPIETPKGLRAQAVHLSEANGNL